LRRSKYNSSFVKVDGLSFHSQWEADYWCLLSRLADDRYIDRLERQVRYPLLVKDIKVGTSILDFRFIELDVDGNPVRKRIQDTKGYINPKDTSVQLWKMKHKIVTAMTGLSVEIITKKDMLREIDDEENKSLSALDRRIRAELVAIEGRGKPRRKARIRTASPAHG